MIPDSKGSGRMPAPHDAKTLSSASLFPFRHFGTPRGGRRMAKRGMEGDCTTKRVKVVHRSLLDTTSPSLRRRLRKICDKMFQPATFRFTVHARLLCVGMSVVYRVSLSLTITSACISRVSTSSGDHRTQSSWVIAMTQTKCRAFHARLDAMLHHSSVTRSLVPPLEIQPLETQQVVVEWKPYHAFLPMLTDVLERYQHLPHIAFSTQAHASTMQARKIELETFLIECWTALQLVAPVLALEPYVVPDPLGRAVLSIYCLMRDFLALPDNVLDVHRNYASAILSLEDATERRGPLTHAHPSCSICLEPLLASSERDHSTSDPQSTDTNRAPSTNEKARVPLVADFSVQLPCAHTYHENCALLWLRHNPTCPECREPVGTRSDRRQD
ncbi:hypothetical protein PsorP6_017629 [Peronosclerospora sorghi]|uniref:Uncharacterized protein n=1 Tax=Peronosclerospora sorghi TaxID=230839 RepID=A0ACC0WL36_9STRA|nr:hypothetical protein PsorP6_017629 [Peronosclerospora sorghi]